MSTPEHGWPLIAYWAAWLAAMWLPRFLYRGERQYEAWEIYAAHPKYARILRLYPYVTGAFGASLFGGLLYVLYLYPQDSPFLVHLAGLLFGVSMVFDASFTWHTEIRPLPSFGPRRFVIEAQPSWRTKLMVRIAFAYCAVALALLSASAW